MHSQVADSKFHDDPDNLSMIQGSVRDQAARAVRQEVEQHGGQLRLAVATLGTLFAVERFDGQAAQDALDALGAQDVQVQGSLAGTGADQVTLTIAGRQAPSRPTQEPPAQPVGPPMPTPAEAVAAQAAALPAAGLAAGVLIPGVALTALGFSGWWVFGALFLGLTGGTWWLLRRARFGLARVFLFPLRSAFLSALTLGALPLLLGALILSLIVVAPVSAKRSSDARERDARQLVAQASRAVRERDPDRARRLLAAARNKDADAEGYGRVRAQADALASAQARERARDDQYRQATAASEDEDFEAAVAGFEALGAFRDSPQRAQQARRRGAGIKLAQAREALGDRDYRRARELADSSIELRPTKAARDVRAQAQRELQAARERSRQRRLAREREQREAERREREEQEALEEPIFPEDDGAGVPDDGGGSVDPGNPCNGSPVPEFPDQRDGDGDGCYGE